MRTNGRAFGSRAKRGFAGLVAAATLGFAAALSPASAQTQETYLVTIDQAFVVRLLNPVAAIVIGNPTIADATILDNMTLVITGRSYGTTNLIVLSISGDVIIDKLITVQSAANLVTVYRRATRQTYSCTPIYAPTLNVGDAGGAFAATTEQIQARAALALGP